MKICIEISDSAIKSAAEKGGNALAALIVERSAMAFGPHLAEFARLDRDPEAEGVFIETHVTFRRERQDRNAYERSLAAIDTKDSEPYLRRTEVRQTLRTVCIPPAV